MPFHRLSVLILALALTPPGTALRAADSPSPPLNLLSTPRALADVGTLSGAAFNGRQAGTADDAHSAAYVATRLSSLGLATEEQRAPLRGTHIEEGASLGMESAPPFQLVVDYLPVLDSPSVSLTATVVFVGYGISDPARGFDEYAGVTVRDRIVLFLRGKPERYPGVVTQTDKERAAREHGAAAFLTMTAPIVSGYEARRGVGPDPVALYSNRSGSDILPGAWIRTDLGETLLARDGRNVRERQHELDRLEPQSIETPTRVSLAWRATAFDGTMITVAAWLPGRDPERRDEIVIVGAHRDHFGRQAGVLFPGADDNASGTAILLEVARVFSESPLKPRRSLLFLSFSGEEAGLLGSRLYVRSPLRPLPRTVAMINVDHAGVGNGRLTVGVSGMEKERAVKAGTAAQLAGLLDLFGFFPGGDHVPFKEAGIATVAVVTSGPHPHVHRPTDTAETVAAEPLDAALRYITALAWELAEN